MKFKVYCEYQDYRGSADFFIVREEGLDKERQAICTSLDNMEFKNFELGENIKPTFSLTSRVFTPFLQAMANNIKELGIKADDEPILENELIAVKYHLEDMRKLVFKK